MIDDVLDYTPFADNDTAAAFATAITVLARRRGLRHPDAWRHRDPAIRLHLLASLNAEARDQLLETILIAYDHGYSPTQLATLLDHHTI